MSQREQGKNEHREVTFEIKEHFGVLSTANSGWTTEFNLVKWNQLEPRYDIRDWNPDHQKMSRGITLTHDEAVQLCEILPEAVQLDFVSGKKDLHGNSSTGSLLEEEVV